MNSLLAVEALSLRLRSRLGFLLLSSNLRAVLFEVPLLLPFALFLKLVVSSTINTWCFSWFLPSSISASRRARELLSSSLEWSRQPSTLDVFLDFYLRRFQHHEELGNYFRHPLHTIVHHEVLLTWWWWLENSAWWWWLENSVNHYFIWKINSHLIQVIVVLRQSEHMLTSLSHSPPSCSCRSYWRLHISQSGHLLEILTSTPETSHMLHDVQNVLSSYWASQTFITSASAPAIGLSPSGASRT